MPARCPQKSELRQHGCHDGKQAHKADQAQKRQGPRGGRLVARPPPGVFVIHVLRHRRLLNVIANAGISIDKDNSSLDEFSVIRRTLDVNVGGVLITVEPLLARMIARKHGQRAIVASLASFIGLPCSAPYNASKATVRVWGESIRYVLKKDGIDISVVCPGFEVSRMTAQARFRMPFLMTAPRASAIIRRHASSAFPIGSKAAVWLGQALPGGWTACLLGV